MVLIIVAELVVHEYGGLHVVWDPDDGRRVARQQLLRVLLVSIRLRAQSIGKVDRNHAEQAFRIPAREGLTHSAFLICFSHLAGIFYFTCEWQSTRC